MKGRKKMKKNLKRLTKLKSVRIIAALIVATFVLTPIVSVFAETKPTFYFQAVDSNTPTQSVDITKLKRGDEFRLNIMLKDASNYQAMAYTITYDPNAFEYVKHGAFTDIDSDSDTSKLLQDSEHHADEGLVSYGLAVYPSFEKNYGYNGRIGFVVFKVKDTAAGNYEFGFKQGSTDGSADTNIKRLVNAGDVGSDGTYVSAEYDNLEFDAQSITATVEIPTNSINLSVSDTLNMIVGDKKDLTVTPDPVDTTVEKNLSVTSSSSEVATFENGQIVAKKTGNATLTVKAYGKEKTVTVHVTNPIKKLYFDEESVTILGANQTKQLTVKTKPENPDNKTVTWKSLNPEIATVDTNGLVTAVKAGDATIQVTSNANSNISTTITVHVVVPVTRASIDKTSLSLTKGQSQDVTITYEPKVANTSVTWSVDKEGIVSLQEKTLEDGKLGLTVTAIGGGKTNLKGKLANCNEGVTCEFTVSVDVTVPLESVTIQKDNNDITTLDIYAGETVNLKYAYHPSDATGLEGTTATWASDNDNVTITNEGVLTGVKAGTTSKITVTFKDKTATLTVNVKTPVSGGTITPSDDVNLVTSCDSSKGVCEKELSVLFTPANADEKPAITWAVKEGKDVVSVNDSGVVKALKAGDAVVTASYTTFDGKTTVLEKKVHVTVALESIQFEENQVTVHRNESMDLPKLILNPENATLNGAEPKYSYDSDAIEIRDGKIYGLKKGTAVVHVTLLDEETTLTVTVDVPVKNIVVKDEEGQEVKSLLLARGSSKVLSAEVVPEDADDTTVTWGIEEESKEGVLTIDPATGAIHALKKGTATIYAKAGSFKKTIQVEVNVPVESFTAEKKIEFYKGEVNKVLPPVTITPSDADDQEITWTIQDKSVVKVDKDGYLVGLKEGTTEITGTLKNGMSVTIEVTVMIIPLDDFEVDLPEYFLKGRPTQLQMKPIPENSTEFENFLFESSDEDVFVVDENGVITGVKEGDATLTITVAGITKKFKLHVREIHAESIEVNAPGNTLKVGESMTISPYALPEDCTDELTYTYKSSDESIATVDENGFVTGVKAGKVTITIEASNGMTKTFDLTIVSAAALTKPPVNPKTGVESPLPYFIVSFVSVVGITTLGYKKWKLEK